MTSTSEYALNSPPGGDSRGSNQLGMRQYNERVILQLIRRSGGLPKAEIARLTNLSAQTVSVIINRLLDDKLLRKQAPQREKGKVGQPSVPISLNPAGAYSIGVKIGRRSLDVLMIDFLGKVLTRVNHPYNFPDPDFIFARIEQEISAIIQTLKPAQRHRLVGIGVAAPNALGGWQQELNAPAAMLARWNEINIRQQIEARQDLPVWFANDATAACIAELVFDHGMQFSSYLYLFVGTFIGGGIVLNNTLYTGINNNAGAVGSMPMPTMPRGLGTVTDSAAPVQLINCASRYLLEDQLRSCGLDPEQVLQHLAAKNYQDIPAQAIECYETWLQNAAAAIAFAITSAISIIDFEGVIIDGIFPSTTILQLVTLIEDALDRMDLEGLLRPRLVAGTLGNDARALGGAILPLYSNFAPDRDVLLKLGVTTGN
ncbi:MAG: ROK family transcriptional regulator [Candidatus Competibacteraceae bacterium]|nr:ROK family transcriptional regulator [Candidatus Competibacteraceae bacterium]